MAFHTVRNTSLSYLGPVIEVIIYPSQPLIEQLHREGKTLTAFKAMALIDTGASITCISDTIVQKLALTSLDYQEVHTAAGITEQLFYDINVSLPVSETKMLPVQAPCADLSGQPFQVLLGRDILSMCSLFYNGMDNCFVLHF